MLRALHIGKFFPPFAGGMEYFLRDLLGALSRQGIEVAALVHDHLMPRQRRCSHHPDPAEWPFPVYRAPCHGRFLYAPVSPQFPFWLQKTIRDFKPDLLHLHLPNTSAFWAMVVPVARRLPWIIHWHADVVASRHDKFLAPAYLFYRPFEQSLLGGASAIIATSPPYLNSSLALRLWREKCHTIPLGLDPSRLPGPSETEQADAHRLWGDGTSLRVLTIGRLTYYKGHEVLLHAIKALPEARLVVVGAGAGEGKLRALIAKLALEGRVSLQGGCTEAQRNALLATCDVFCLPSIERTEAFGVVLLEAMKFAKPVVASRIEGSGVGWVVADGETGILCPPQDPASLTQALGDLLHTPEKRESLGKAGEQRFRQYFQIDRIAERTAVLYPRV
ncbi:glycosyltransferase [Nitrosococcus oceani]|uniref:Glycosyl transferase, group 1 n=2 Tax=Nitrosococcus oceani TaxID=1229 RepID=Q3J761_NITOC|nr:glycosyltransferase [Nitrosococcus oceani]KFI18221.1 glycosyl transferase family 1 [Nitrosococcus oceani C-27]ABA59335.1 Glycosyl transferase, group 1 [Nitrosococcus oceani ATCC 19707]EDZ66291.1 glycosyl transferase, group 1 family protein [Nitrosococcus oceani AFC27]KFI21538.1 glycosyl transferase family 1 [Nitrosococcus oceani]GEM20096.1 glycosyl transferase family 1 [Nitrosococcus oceani]